MNCVSLINAETSPFFLLKKEEKVLKKTTLAEMYSEPCGTTKMQLFVKIING